VEVIPVLHDLPAAGTFGETIRRVLKCLPVLALSAMSGCATVFGGTSQDIAVNTNPAGASCVFTREGMTIGTIPITPAVLNIPRRKYDVMITCNKPGYEQASYLNHSGVSGAIAGNVAADLLLTAGLSSIIDSADGADNRYDSAVNMTLEPSRVAGGRLVAVPATSEQPVPPPRDADDAPE
jgi:hypothetical protein